MGDVTFPGNVLKVSGGGVFENGSVNAVGEIRFKHPATGGTNQKWTVSTP